MLHGRRWCRPKDDLLDIVLHSIRAGRSPGLKRERIVQKKIQGTEKKQTKKKRIYILHLDKRAKMTLNRSREIGTKWKLATLPADHVFDGLNFFSL